MSSIHSTSSMRLQPPPPASPPGSENERVRVKMMEQSSIEFVLKWSGMGNSIRSREFVVGGHLFSLEFYRYGCDWESYCKGEVSLFIKNENEIDLDVVVDLHILNQSDFGHHLGYSCFHDRESYKRVARIEAGKRFGYVNFWPKWRIQSSGAYVKDDSIKIRATIGVFIDAEMGLPLERCILFQVSDQRYYVEESVVTTRCRALLFHSHSDSQADYILISDVDNHVFKAMLWFLDNQLTHKWDTEAIVSSKGSRPNSFALSIHAAADRFDLKDLRAQCESLVSYGMAAQQYYALQSECKAIWTYGCSLWSKVKEAISEKIKES